MAYTVSFINRYLKSLIETDIQLSDIEVEGEVSDITFHSKGHVYFTLKEEKSVLPAVMFRGNAEVLSFKPRNGDKVIVRGRVTTYEAGGRYQIIVNTMKMSGEGELYIKFLELKEKLQEMGMFDEEYKRPLPRYIKKLGVVTSPTGAAIRDIINVTRRRNPYVQIILSPVLVQGEGAAESIADGIASMQNAGCDVLIVGRGGGSTEDLWAFNEEIVARAIFSSSVPVISAVGHEINISISDFVADVYAPTPSAAAELAVYDVRDLFGQLYDIGMRMQSLMERGIDLKRQRALEYGRRLNIPSPMSRIKQDRQRLAAIRERMAGLMRASVDKKRAHMQRIAAGLNALSPAARLSQGYSYITDKTGNNIMSVDQIKKGDIISARLSDGYIDAEITDIR